MSRRHAIVFFFSVPALSIFTAGCTEDEKATPQIIFEGRLERGASTNDCQDDGDLFKIGDPGNLAAEPPVPSAAVKDGQSYGQGAVSVSCTVTSAGTDEFNVQASVDLSGATGGFFRIDGKFKTTGDQSNIHALFSSRRTTNTYEQQDRTCTVRYGAPVQGVAAGRVWGEINCPSAVNVKLGGQQKKCEAIAEFRFENCAQ